MLMFYFLVHLFYIMLMFYLCYVDVLLCYVNVLFSPGSRHKVQRQNAEDPTENTSLLQSSQSASATTGPAPLTQTPPTDTNPAPLAPPTTKSSDPTELAPPQSSSSSSSQDIDRLISELESQRNAIKGGDETPKPESRQVLYPLSPLSVPREEEEDDEEENVAIIHTKKLPRQDGVDSDNDMCALDDETIV